MATRKAELDEAEVHAGTEHLSAARCRLAAERRRRPIDPKRLARAKGHLGPCAVARHGIIADVVEATALQVDKGTAEVLWIHGEQS